jgi:hypothetical protein
MDIRVRKFLLLDENAPKFWHQLSKTILCLTEKEKGEKTASVPIQGGERKEQKRFR